MGEKTNYVKENDEIIQKETLGTRNRDGVNLLDIFNSQFVDFVNTYSNDILEVNSVVGIEAARNILIEEITSVMSDVPYINNRHIELVQL